MLKEKFKLSETLQLLTRRFNKIAGGEVAIEVTFEGDVVSPGDQLSARVTVRSPESSRTIDYLVIAMRGTVQREGKWREYTESAEVAQSTLLEADHELVVPLKLYIPEDAVLSEDGASWLVEARVVLDQLLDPRASAEFTVELGAHASEEE